MYENATLSEVLIQNREFIEFPESKIYPKLSVKLYGRGVVLDGYADGSLLKMKRHQLAKPGQVILSEIWGKKGAIGIVPPEGAGALCTSHFFLFDMNLKRIDPSYLKLILAANYLQGQLGAEAKGTTGYAAIRPKSLLAATIPLPLLPEQHRLVRRVEELTVKIEEAHRLRTASMEQLVALRGAIARSLFGTHESQAYASIEELAEVRGGIQKSPHRSPGANPVRYLTVAHVQRDHISIDDPRFFEVTSDEFQRWRLVPGDVLVVEGNGSATQIGRTALFRGEIADCVHQNHVIRIRPNRDVLSPEFLNQYLNSPIGREAVQAQSRSTSGLQTLSVGRVKSLQVPRLSLPMQEQLVVKLREYEVAMDQVAQLQETVARSLAALTPSILDRAFRGGL